MADYVAHKPLHETVAARFGDVLAHLGLPGGRDAAQASALPTPSAIPTRPFALELSSFRRPEATLGHFYDYEVLLWHLQHHLDAVLPGDSDAHVAAKRMVTLLVLTTVDDGYDQELINRADKAAGASAPGAQPGPAAGNSWQPTQPPAQEPTLSQSACCRHACARRCHRPRRLWGAKHIAPPPADACSRPFAPFKLLLQGWAAWRSCATSCLTAGCSGTCSWRAA